jgi:hypothetical protein
LATRACSPVAFDLLDGYEDCGASPFAIRSVLDDFRKNTLQRCLDPEIDFILIDFISEASGSPIDAYLIGDSAILNSYAYTQLQPFIKHAEPSAAIGNDQLIELWDRHIAKTLKFFRGHEILEKLVVHRCFHAEQQKLSDGSVVSLPQWVVDGSQRANVVLKHFYDTLQSRAPTATVIEIDRAHHFVNPDHKFGLSASHFIQSYYDELLAQLLKLKT